MQDRDHIISLGRLLAAELRRGCDDTAAELGLDHFLAQWQAQADGALDLPAVQATFALLADYGAQSVLERRARVTRAVEDLRGLFRHETAPPPPAPPAKKKRTRPPASPPQPPAPVRTAADLALADSLDLVPGIERRDVTAFRRLGLKTVEDLLYHVPHRYDDFSSQHGIADLEVGAVGTLIAEVSDVRLVGGGPRSRVEVTFSDTSGSIRAVFFNQPWLPKQLTVGRQIVLSGKVSSYQGLRQMTGPTWEPYVPDGTMLHTGRLVPVHPLSKGLHERNARKTIKFVVDAMSSRIVDHLPEMSRQRCNLLPLGEALAQIHYPDTPEQLQQARTRLGFDEFLFIQLGVLQRKLLWQGELGYQLAFLPDLHQQLLDHVGFRLTNAQQRVLDEIFRDMARPLPMARLLQGDVGSGKTVVAAAALVQAIGNGFQGALMAPTEILAEQHYKGLKRLLGKLAVPRAARQEAEGETWKDRLEPEEAAKLAEIKALLGMTDEEDMAGQGVRVALLTGSLGIRARRRVLEGVANGEIDLVIGTHALITEGVRFQSLGLVVVDEQHRFGVEQRQRLRDKGFNPHLLVMTATPIPRTLTMTIYGDLDTSILDELPPGREPIRTRWVRKAERSKAYRHLRREIEQGRQAFVICPLVEESEKVDLPSAEEMYETLQGSVFPDLRVTLLHGRMLPREKDEVMLAFRDHAYDIMVATAVIEVGIDIPNASTILIEGAERFGLAQLHQFRGRVGRGAHKSYCILISDKDDNAITRQRLEAMEQTNDGFKLSEVDLQLRGPGEFFGTRQSGTPDLKVARLADTRLLYAARNEAELILNDDVRLSKPEHALLKQKVDAFWAEAAKAG
ncbi:ATP-dependent DNA helicase RecG [Candidatus Chloroploca asiatica]|uniref:ATP-dependent DNA helicase RecG n=1 Tax=Candidatus Chloroploca asiatica TaxID=1506545 RepID=A0A2H3KZ19_9CHLR|nr:ATP-dependent DNA helicase RecG [Candidatus Chloroploca asiatica]PDV97606.1 ATP-dependent DNA helicase RecG [Candidatus Chloroploca asiatica]